MKETGRRYLAGIIALAAAASCMTAAGAPSVSASTETADYYEGTEEYGGTDHCTESPETTTTAEDVSFQEGNVPFDWYDEWEDYRVEDNVRYACAAEKNGPVPRLVVRECMGSEKTVEIPEHTGTDLLYNPYSTVIGVEYDGTTVKAGEGTRQRHLILPDSVSWASFYDFSADDTPDDPANYYDLFTVLTFNNPNCEIRIPKIGQIKALLAQDGLTLTIRGFAGSTAEAYAKKNGLPFENLRMTAGDLTYEERGGCAIVNGWHGESTSLTIPAEIDGMPVTGIGKGAFYQSELKSITLPDSLKEIGEDAFRGCTKLTSVILPDSIGIIGECAFMHCYHLNSVRLPESVKRIEGWAFYDCTDLTDITIPDGCEEIGQSAFSSCSLNSVILPDSVTAIGEGAFSDCGWMLNEVHLSACLTEIPESAFSGIGTLDSVEIPAGVKKIGYDAFETLNKLVVLSPDCEFDEEFMDANSSPFIYGFSGSTAEAYAEAHQMVFTALDSSETIRPDYEKNLVFRLTDNRAYVTGLSDETPHLIIPDEYKGCPVVGIDANAFAEHEELLTVEIPDTVREIGRMAFAGCGLYTVTLPGGLTELADGVFSACGRLQSVVLPETLTRIGINAFADSFLKHIDLPESLTEIGDGAFSGTHFTEFTVPDSVKKLGNSMFAYCYWLKSVTLPAGITRIGSYMFRSCDALTEFVVPNTVTEIGEGAFFCSGLKSVTLPESLTVIPPYAFDSCTDLTQITIPEHVTTISKYAFHDCHALQRADLPDGLQIIGSLAFYNTALREVTLPVSVQEAGYGAFAAIPNAVKLTVLNPNCTMMECLSEGFGECNQASCILGCQNSTAHAYANWLGIRFFDLDGKEIKEASTQEYQTSYGDEEAWNHTGIAGTESWCYETTTTAEYSGPTGDTVYETTGMEKNETTTTPDSAIAAETMNDQIASDEVLCSWAVSDYQSKTGAAGIRAEITSVHDGKYIITLTDQSGRSVEEYSIDPSTGIGVNTADEAVNLPQTGNNKLTGLLTVIAGFLLTVCGWHTFTASGILRRKKDEQTK